MKTFGPASNGDTKGFGGALKTARIKKGITQEQAARLAGIDPGTLARWEGSDGLPPKWMQRKLVDLRRALGVSLLPPWA